MLFRSDDIVAAAAEGRTPRTAFLRFGHDYTVISALAAMQVVGRSARDNMGILRMAYSPELLPGKSHGWRSLVGCSPWGCTEGLHFHFPLSCIGEGNGNPLQHSCLENPRDGSLVGCCLWGRTESDMIDMT